MSILVGCYSQMRLKILKFKNALASYVVDLIIEFKKAVAELQEKTNDIYELLPEN